MTETKPVFRIRGYVAGDANYILDLAPDCRLADLVQRIKAHGRLDLEVQPFLEQVLEKKPEDLVSWVCAAQTRPRSVSRFKPCVRFERPYLRIGFLGNLEVLVRPDQSLLKHIPVHVPGTAELVMQRYPRITAHLICESLGYATPTGAANIVWDAARREENWCEWIYSCYGKNPRPAVQSAISNRHTHSGYMAEYKHAIALVREAICKGDQTVLASWF